MRPGSCERADQWLYDGGLLDAATGGLLRPGGLALTGRAVQLCALRAGARVVDVGCGTGATVGHLRHAFGLRAVGVEASPGVLGRRCGEARGALVQGQGAELPLRAGSAEGVLLECCLSAMAEPARVLAECRRVLEPGGRLAVTDLFLREGPARPLHRGPARAGEVDGLPAAAAGSCVAGALTRDALLASLRRGGFAVEVWEDHSRALVELLAGLLLAHGSLRPFWEGQCAPGGDPGALERAVRGLRPGYFLLVARKELHPRTACGESDER